MNLVDYSDSEGESDSSPGSPPPAPKPQHATLPKRKQIIVDLPKPVRTEDDGSTKKRVRPEGAGGSGLFAVLPPPKRTKSAPKPVSTQVEKTENGDGVAGSVEMTETKTEVVATTAFMPRNTQTKKGKVPAKQAPPAPKQSISLFPLGPDLVSKPITQTTSNPSIYEPLIAQPIDPIPTNSFTNDDEPPFIPDTTAPPPSTMSTDDLDSFAAHILEGRHRKNRTINIMDFNAAEMYAQNAADKASGLLQEQIAPVRAIGSGRHQLTQLLNNVQDQKESLEEAFAKGRRTKKESAARYGW